MNVYKHRITIHIINNIGIEVNKDLKISMSKVAYEVKPYSPKSLVIQETERIIDTRKINVLLVLFEPSSHFI